MADHRITDFVDQQAIDKLVELNSSMITVRNTFEDVARKLLTGLRMKVEGLDDLERMMTALAAQEQRAAGATQELTRVVSEQKQVVANTTNTISRQLMEQEKLNEKTRTAYQRHSEVRDILNQLNGDYQASAKRMAEVEAALQKVNEKKKDEKKLYDEGKMTHSEYTSSLASLIEKHRQLTIEKSNLSRQMKMMEKEESAAFSSYDAMSQQLAQMKRAYRELNEETRQSEFGQNMLAEIKELGAHLKDLDASMGDFQRNVGDYAIACQNGVTNTEDLNRVLGIEAATVAGCIEQNKALEQAKLSLDTRDANYEQTLSRVNAKIDENRRRILDVDAILSKEATTVGEAEAQNRQLTEALKLVDLNGAGAAQRIAELNAKIAENKRVIESATPALHDNAEALDEQRKKSEGMANQMLTLMGLNSNFGSSIKALSETAAAGGKIFDGLGVKLKSFGRTLVALCTDPWMLAVLGVGAGIAGTVAGFKWWYDYNKGLIEATRLTKDFTGKSGEDMKIFRSRVQAVADTFGKDFKETLNAADKLAVQFGISYERALTIIEDGFIANADAQGDMLANIERFSPAFQQAGISASEFMAIVAQTRSGIFTVDGLAAIQMATDRIRRMPKSAKEALQAIGIDVKQMQKDLSDGAISMMDAVQMVSAKLKELPDNSEEVGRVLFAVFGRKGPAAGLEMIRSIADLNTSLDDEKEKLGELGKIQERQLESQKRLSSILAQVFDATGGSFEGMIAMAKTFVNDGISLLIQGCVETYNWFTRLYNASKLVRIATLTVVNNARIGWIALKNAAVETINAIEGIGNVLEALATFDTDDLTGSIAKLKGALADVRDSVKDGWRNFYNDVSEMSRDTLRRVKDDTLQEITIDYSIRTSEESRPGGVTGIASHTLTDDEREKARRDAEKEAKEEIKRLNALDEAKVKAMTEGHEKEMETIRLNYAKKLREITGNSEEEEQTRVSLIMAMHQELDECERKYQEKKGSIDIANILSVAKKESEAYLNAKLAQLDAEYDAEIREAEKTGADKAIIAAKYAKLYQDAQEEHAEARIDQIEKEYAAEQAIADNAYAKFAADRQRQYAAELKAAGSNAQKREEATRSYERDIAAITENAAIDTAMRQVEMIEKVLLVENMSAEERERLERELAKAKISLAQAITDAEVAENQRRVDADTEATQKRIANAQKWLQVASDGLNAINGLASAVYDSKIEKIENEQTALEESSSAEQDRIAKLVEQNVITQEEGEARKRAAEEKTARKNEELEKKKQQLKYKQAVWDKANSIAQIGIATALAIMKVVPDPVKIAIVSAMGALQLATALATPIPKYAEGTPYHRGGVAIVGDAGEHEVVAVGDKMYITPNKPTLVDMPRGAKVFPNIMDFEASASFIGDSSKMQEAPHVIVNNDYRALQTDVRELARLIRNQTKQQHRDAYNADFERWIAMKGL